MYNLLNALVIMATIFLPMICGVARRMPEGKDVRIDNVSLSNLDSALKGQGIPPSARATIIAAERARRGGTLNNVVVPTPEQESNAYPVPPQPNGLGPWVAQPCSEGQGCTWVWSGAGTLNSQWYDRLFVGPTAWSNLIVCPVGKVCTVASTAPSRSDRHWTGFRAFSTSLTPVYHMNTCFWTA